ncbi:MAG: glutamate-5-semialdehyde dehydrogenase [Alphaproteobacteria bacterium]|nr:glutamate-5-semialdehyde dehydrogenase [Alphaproteobacteria bacterium]
MIQKPNITTHQETPEGIMASMGAASKSAAAVLAQTTTGQINAVLKDLAQFLKDQSVNILSANALDVKAAQDKNLASALIDRLSLTEERINALAQSVVDIIQLDDPVGRVLETTNQPNGLIIDKVSVPIGVLGMIYESRPNVTIDAAALCLKSRNAVILRGGSESFNSSRALHAIVQQALKQHSLPEESVSMLPSTDRALVGTMLQANDYIDVIIPRGGKGLTSRVMNEAKMPVFAHLDGNCHLYVHESVNADLALRVIQNAKLRRTGICGAAESLLFDLALDTELATSIIKMLLDQGCDVVGDERVQVLNSKVAPATEEDWSTEYLDKKISIKYVEGVEEAITHINTYGSHHTDAILAEDDHAVQEFQKRVDSAIVMHNASTQFADGGEFGMGAEIGIGTGKLHARGPVGLKQLTTFKYLVKGTGQTRP